LDRPQIDQVCALIAAARSVRSGEVRVIADVMNPF
jgi:hypothetical protein